MKTLPILQLLWEIFHNVTGQSDAENNLLAEYLAEPVCTPDKCVNEA
jgi:hypothetical protein